MIGWKEFEMEVVRDKADNCIIICSIENLDPMGVHTGDSITVAPAQTLTDKEYQIMRNASIAVLREIGVETGGSNVQFAINPADGKMLVIEMNPRVSRSSALASKATGFPIAKVAGQARRGLHPGRAQERDYRRRDAVLVRAEHRLRRHQDPALRIREVPPGRHPPHHANEIGGRSDGDRRTFQESLQKALRGLRPAPTVWTRRPPIRRCSKTSLATPARSASGTWPMPSAAAFPSRRSRGDTHIDPWFLAQIEDLVRQERELKGQHLEHLDTRALLTLKRNGFSDRRLATLLGTSEHKVRERRHALGVRPGVQARRYLRRRIRNQYCLHVLHLRGRVRSEPDRRRKIMVLGGGPNRIGQGIEFDYCCVHAALALREDGFETIMVNCNPETVSTDYDTSDRLYFEPLTLEDVTRDRGQGEALRRGGAVWRADAAEARALPGGERRAHHRHQPGHDRRGRGPRALPETAARAGPEAAAQPDRAQRDRRTAPRAGNRLSAGGAAELRARRPRHGDRARAARPRALHARGGEGFQRLAGAARPLPSTMPSKWTWTPSATAGMC